MPRMPKRPDYGSATPADLARALLRAGRPRPTNPTEPANRRAPVRERPDSPERL